MTPIEEAADKINRVIDLAVGESTIDSWKRDKLMVEAIELIIKAARQGDDAENIVDNVRETCGDLQLDKIVSNLCNATEIEYDPEDSGTIRDMRKYFREAVEEILAESRRSMPGQKG